MKNQKINIAIFASGNGSNAEALIKKSLELENIEVKLIYSNKANPFVKERAKKYNIPFFHINYSKNKTKTELEIIELLKSFNIDWVFLAGYMKIIEKELLKYFWDEEMGYSKIVNIHPSLLPQFPGKDAYAEAYYSNVPESGITIHLVDSGIDSGPIIKQKAFKRFQTDTLGEFKERGLSIEHKLYSSVLEQLSSNQTLSPNYFTEQK